MKVPFLDLKEQYSLIKTEIDNAIQNVIDQTDFILGKSVTKFQESFALAHNVKYCFGTSSGTAANHIALWSLGIGRGDEVIIPANTFIATAWGATLCGATPVFVDCESDSYNINPQKVEEAITPRTKAIVAVHLYGQPAKISEIRKIASKYNLYLVEDAAQAHFAEYEGKKVGSTSIVSSFSFYPGKNLGAYGEAGCVVTNNDLLAKKIEMLRNHGQATKYVHDTYGHNYRMEGIQGAVLGVKLKYIESWTNARRENARTYMKLLKDVNEIILPEEAPNCKHVYHLFVIQTKKGNGERDKLMEYLNNSEITTGLHYPIPLHVQKCFSHLGYKKGDFPVTEKLAENGLSLPMYPELSRQQIFYVCNRIKKFYAKTRVTVVRNHGTIIGNNSVLSKKREQRVYATK